MEISVSTLSVCILKVAHIMSNHTGNLHCSEHRNIKKGSSITSDTNLYIIIHDEL